ncbi:MAG TPA: serine/threonine-protein kinase [Gemmataceae bacterium]|nr:serine/threonine-protein kinase [Gemmataceae bacterium]
MGELNRNDPPPTLHVSIPLVTMAARGPDDTPPPRNRPRSALLAEAFESAVPPRMPSLGDELFGFTLVEELGQGSFARVYLATQQSLSGRLVAVKVTMRATREPDKLARLQHSNVVPVYSVHETESLQVICMPFVGRRTLSHLLGDFRRDHPSKRFTGRRSAVTLKPGSTTVEGRVGKGLSGPFAAAAPPTGEPVPLIGDVPAVLAALAGLAAGLGHAHGREILHLDIKPANVLFADTGELMLLDFNLSYDKSLAQRDMVGGTIQYMAPEQLHDIRTGGKGAVDARTDLYSLGVLAYEMLTGSVPFPPDTLLLSFDELMEERRKPVPRASAVNPAVTPAVDAILAKLLSADPVGRYQSAGDLREDIRLHLADEPLKFARNTSLGERAAKWRRRNPRLLGWLVAAAMLAAAGGALVFADRQSTARATADAVVQFRDSRAALGRLRLDLILSDDPRATARGLTDASASLARYGLPDEADWRKRDSFARLPAESQSQISQDLGEVLLLQAHAKWRAGKRLADADAQRDAAADAVRLNRAARGCFPNDQVPVFLRKQFTELAAATGELDADATDDDQKPRTAREFFLGAVGEFAASRYSAAAALLESAVAGEPDHAAAQMMLAVCRHHQGQYGGAVERYDAARVLIPTDPRPFFFRGIALATSGKPARAADEFTKAIDLDPEYREAYRNRAVALRSLGKLPDAERDLTRGLEMDGPPFQFHQMRARVRSDRQNAAGAAEDMKAIAALKAEWEMDFIVRAWARGDKQADESLADYREAEKRNPRSAMALLGQVQILADVQHKQPEALEVATRLTKMLPDFATAWAARAVVLARLGQVEEAKAEAEHARTLSDEAAITYRLACVYALTGKANAADLTEAMAFLRKAFRDGYRNLGEFEKDPDLDALRKLPAFADFLKAAREVAR